MDGRRSPKGTGKVRRQAGVIPPGGRSAFVHLGRWTGHVRFLSFDPSKERKEPKERKPGQGGFRFSLPGTLPFKNDTERGLRAPLWISPGGARLRFFSFLTFFRRAWIVPFSQTGVCAFHGGTAAAAVVGGFSAPYSARCFVELTSASSPLPLLRLWTEVVVLLRPARLRLMTDN